MNCAKTSYPNSKYNYVTCTSFIERFSGTPETTDTSSGTSGTIVDATSGTATSGTGTMTAGSGINCTGTVSADNKLTLMCEIKNKEGFADTMTPTPTSQEMVNNEVAMTTAKLATSTLPGANLPTLATAAGANAATKQNKQDTTCNKTSLYVTIVILVILLIALASYVGYQQMKNNNR